jgi:hypothetical protein
MPDSIAQHYIPSPEQAAKDATYLHTGFVAQEVEALARRIGYDFDGVNAPKNPTDNYSIAYSQFVPSLVKAVQEQQREIEKSKFQVGKLEKEIEKLSAENLAMKSEINASKAQLEKISELLEKAGFAKEK